MEELKLLSRDKKVCHSARKDRVKGMIPGVIYGKEIGNVLFDVNYIDLEKELCASGEHGIVKFNLNDKSGTAVIKQIQKNNFGNKIIHVDLEEVAADYKMHTEVAIKINGKGLLESKGLIFQTQKDLVKVVCTPKDLPKEIELDVSEGKAGKVYTFNDLNLGDNVQIDEDAAGVIGSVTAEERNVEEDSESSTSTTEA
ncbi:MAG: 50S ribosomal protein L25 [Clostridium butyricum]|nr:50S ribosomal protein L25 [Clostridium butyricum]